MTELGLPAAASSLREELSRLDEAGLLRRVSREVEPRFEIAAVAKAAEHGPALLFENVRGSKLPVAMNTLSSRELLATSFGVPIDGIASRLLDALLHPIAPRIQAEAPVQEVVLRGDEIDLRRDLPILTHHEGDGGPYITTGVVFAEDRTGEVRNLSYHRMQVRSARETGIVVVQRHLHRLLEQAESEGRTLPVAIVIGLDSATRLAAATSGSAVPFGFDELGLAGALHGKPVALVPGISIPLHVPADAEIVIEGEIVRGEWQPEGPFAEFDGTYESEPARVFRAKTLTMRRKAVYQGLISGSVEQLNIMGLSNEAVILRSVRAVVPGARSVRVTRGGLRKFHAIVSIEKQHEGDGPDVIIAAFAGHRDLKHMVVVDGDVSPFDDQAVERALATWFRASRDLVTIDGGRGNPVDRSLSESGQTSRLGFDATRPLGETGDRERAIIPGAEGLRLEDYF